MSPVTFFKTILGLKYRPAGEGSRRRRGPKRRRPKVTRMYYRAVRNVDEKTRRWLAELYQGWLDRRRAERRS